MPILIRDEFIEREVARVQSSRGDGTPTKTARDLLRERLSELGCLNGTITCGGGPATTARPTSVHAGAPPHHKTQYTADPAGPHVPNPADQDTQTGGDAA